MSNEYELIDCLQRNEQVNDLITYISNKNKLNIYPTIAINGKWGSGKSFFINLLEPKIENDFIIFKFNAWDNDYYDEPLIGMLDCLKDQLNDINKKENIVKAIGQTAFNIIKELISNYIDFVVEKNIGIRPICLFNKLKKSIKENREALEISSDFNPNNLVKSAKEIIIRSLNKLAKAKKILFIIDELDRCSPDYTMKALERIHHLSMNVERFTTILAVDKTQIDYMIKEYYGHETNPDTYLQKIITDTFELDNGSLTYEKLEEFKNYESHFEAKSVERNIVLDYVT